MIGRIATILSGVLKLLYTESITHGGININIFVLDREPKRSAMYHKDKHVNKMILESAQMLCTAHHVYGNDAPYKKTHVNHPCTKWARESIENYNWLLGLAENLIQEYDHRWGNKVHATTQVVAWLRNNKPNLPSKGVTERPMAMDDEYKTNSIVRAYRNYYIGEKVDEASWTNRPKPSWIVD